jgi:hypothetical protein
MVAAAIAVGVWYRFFWSPMEVDTMDGTLIQGNEVEFDGC